MRLLFLTDNFPPEVNAPANRTYEHCKEWVKHGVEVTVITCAPNFPSGKVFKGYKNKIYQKETVDGIKVIRVWSFITANEGFIKRIIDYLSFALTSFFAGLYIKTDLIIATSPQFFTAVSGASLAFFKRKKWVMEVRDLWPESIVAVGAMKRNLFIRFFEFVEKCLYKSANHIVVVTDDFKEIIANRGISRDKISVFKNGVNLQFYTPSSKKKELLKKYHLENKFIIAYIGTHGLAHGLQFVIQSVQKINQLYPHIHFLFLGDGAEKQNLIDKSNTLKLSNVLFLDSVPKNQILDYLNLMDIALVNLKSSETFKSVIPSKIFEAAAVGKPILLGLEGETKALIEKYNAGICFIPEDEKSFIEAIRKITTNEGLYNQYQAGCLSLAQDFNRNTIAANLLKTLQAV